MQRGCMALNLAVELGPHDQEVAKLLRQEHERIIGLLTAAIEWGQGLGEFRTDLPLKNWQRTCTFLVRACW